LAIPDLQVSRVLLDLLEKQVLWETPEILENKDLLVLLEILVLKENKDLPV
jgi:hypothetical protein